MPEVIKHALVTPQNKQMEEELAFFIRDFIFL